MKLRLLPVFAALLLCSSSVAAVACEHGKKTSAASAAAAKTHATAVTAAAKASCGAHAGARTAAVKADAKSCGAHATAVTADAGSAACRAYGASVVTAGHPVTGSASTPAVAAKAGSACCAAKGAKTTTAATRGAKVDAVLAGSSCQAGAKTATGDHNCDACAELATCDDELRQIGIETQVVPLKNGVMVVYTGAKNGKAHAIQNAMARRTDRLHAVNASGDQARLCPECKTMRGAMASGKLVIETVNIGGGVLTVMTSDDPKMVAKLQSMNASSKT